MHDTFNKKNPIFQQNEFILTTITPQHFILYFKWLNLSFNRINDPEVIKQHKGKILLLETNEINTTPGIHIKPIQYFDKYCMGEIL
jgi:hypothetical protein